MAQSILLVGCQPGRSRVRVPGQVSSTRFKKKKTYSFFPCLALLARQGCQIRYAYKAKPFSDLSCPLLSGDSPRRYACFLFAQAVMGSAATPIHACIGDNPACLLRASRYAKAITVGGATWALPMSPLACILPTMKARLEVLANKSRTTNSRDCTCEAAAVPSRMDSRACGWHDKPRLSARSTLARQSLR